MRQLTHALSAAALALAGATTPASAAWMGLADGDYTVNLHCDNSTVIACPSDIGGSMTLAGGQVTAMNFSVGGDSFVGDPTDTVIDGNLVDTESSTLPGSPFKFLSLRLITAGQIGSYGPGDRWWVYCNSTSPDTCSPNTTGLWSAQAVGRVSEPALPALLLAGGLAAVTLRRRRR